MNLEERNELFHQMLTHRQLSDTAKEFLSKLHKKVLNCDYECLEWYVKNEGELYTFSYSFDDIKYEFYTDDYYEFRIVKKIADSMVL